MVRKNLASKAILTGACAALAVAAILGTALRSQSGETAAPLVETFRPSSSAFDFGVVKSGTIVNVSFSLSNPDEEPLPVTKVHTTCGCTVPVDFPKALPAKSSVDAPFRVNTTGKAGNVGIVINIEFGDGRKQDFNVSGYVVSDRMKEVELNEPLLRGSDDRPLQFSMDWSAKDAEISSLDYDKAKLGLTFERTEDGSRYNFAVHPTEGLAYGKMRETITLKTTSALAPVRQFALSGYVAHPIELEKSVLTFGTLVPGEKKTAEAVFFSPYEQAIHVESIVVDEGLPLEWELRADGTSRVLVTIAATVPADAPSKAQKWVLNATCTAGEFRRSIPIEVYGFLARAG